MFQSSKRTSEVFRREKSTKVFNFENKVYSLRAPSASWPALLFYLYIPLGFEFEANFSTIEIVGSRKPSLLVKSSTLFFVHLYFLPISRSHFNFENNVSKLKTNKLNPLTRKIAKNVQFRKQGLHVKSPPSFFLSSVTFFLFLYPSRQVDHSTFLRPWQLSISVIRFRDTLYRHCRSCS